MNLHGKTFLFLQTEFWVPGSIYEVKVYPTDYSIIQNLTDHVSWMRMCVSLWWELSFFQEDDSVFLPWARSESMFFKMKNASSFWKNQALISLHVRKSIYVKKWQSPFSRWRKMENLICKTCYLYQARIPAVFKCRSKAVLYCLNTMMCKHLDILVFQRK